MEGNNRILISDANELERLRLYQETLEELMSCRLVTDGRLGFRATIKFTRGEPLETSILEPDNQDLKGFLMTFRLLYMQGEPLYFPTIVNLVWKYAPDEHKDAIKATGRHFRDALKRSAISFESDGKTIKPGEFVDLWFYAYYFHVDLDKRKRMDELRRAWPPALLKMAFLNPIIECMDAFRWVNEYITDHIDLTTY